jgi:hypothetical protein
MTDTSNNNKKQKINHLNEKPVNYNQSSHEKSANFNPNSLNKSNSSNGNSSEKPIKKHPNSLNENSACKFVNSSHKSVNFNPNPVIENSSNKFNSNNNSFFQIQQYNQNESLTKNTSVRGTQSMKQPKTYSPQSLKNVHTHRTVEETNQRLLINKRSGETNNEPYRK